MIYSTTAKAESSDFGFKILSKNIASLQIATKKENIRKKCYQQLITSALF
jgi:hypothetical protein